MPKINLSNYDPMEAREKAAQPRQRVGILYDTLEALAVHFGWEDWNHYHKHNYDHAKHIKNEVYHMSHEEKQTILTNIKNSKDVSN